MINMHGIPQNRSCRRKPKENRKMGKQRSTKHYTENYTSSNSNPTKNQAAPLVISHEWGKDR